MVPHDLPLTFLIFLELVHLLALEKLQIGLIRVCNHFVRGEALWPHVPVDHVGFTPYVRVENLRIL